MMSNGGMKRHKRGGGMGASIVPGMGHRKSSSSGMEMPQGQNGFSGNQTHQQKILAAAQHYARLNGGAGGENGFRKGKFSGEFLGFLDFLESNNFPNPTSWLLWPKCQASNANTAQSKSCLSSGSRLQWSLDGDQG